MEVTVQIKCVLGDGDSIDSLVQKIQSSLKSSDLKETVNITSAHIALVLDENPVLDYEVTFLDLSVRTRRALEYLKIKSIRELVRKTGNDLLVAKNFGDNGVAEIREKLRAHNLRLANEK